MADVEVTSSSTNTVDVVGLNDVKADLKLELPQPFKTETVNTYDIKPVKTDSTNGYDIKADVGTNTRLSIDPLKTDSSVAVDLKPAVIDLCLTMNIGKVPSVCIRQPYRHKVGFTLYGVEVWGFSFSGEQETIVDELKPRPQVAWGAAAAWPPTQPAASAKTEPQVASGGGLRIRLGP
jgi:hypothetical protein